MLDKSDRFVGQKVLDMALTDAQVRSFKAENRRIRKSDGGGLYVDIMPSGSRIFRLAYRFGGKQRTLLIGEYPAVKLADARLKAAEHKQMIRDGRDPASISPDPKTGRTGELSGQHSWKDVAKDYVMLRRRSGAATGTLKKLERQIGVTIEHLGDRDLSSITAEDVLAVVNPIAEQGHVENAHEIRSRFSQVFRFAAARGLVAHDPASMTIDAMIPRKRGEFAGIIDPEEVGQLMRDMQTYREDHFWVGSALLLSAYLFPRNTELRGMKWDEVDWERKMWEVPAQRMKMKRAHLFPLPQSALQILSNVREIDLGSALVFPSPRNPTRMLSENTFNSALRRMGYSRERHVHHGFRKTASTNLNELGWNSDWIERQLAHVPANKVRSSYNKAEYIDGRTKMMSEYAKTLDRWAAQR